MDVLILAQYLSFCPNVQHREEQYHDPNSTNFEGEIYLATCFGGTNAQWAWSWPFNLNFHAFLVSDTLDIYWKCMKFCSCFIPEYLSLITSPIILLKSLSKYFFPCLLLIVQHHYETDFVHVNIKIKLTVLLFMFNAVTVQTLSW